MKPIIPNEEMPLPTAFLTDIRSIIDTGRRQAYAAVGQSAIATFWNIGRRIVEEEQNGQGRAAYGTGLIKNLAEQLIPVYGTSYSKRNLDYYRKFYLLFPNEEIVNARVHNLEWTHIRRILSVTNPDARLWYLTTASENMWSTRELDRNISTQYYERRLAAQLPANTSDLPQEIDKDPLEYIKNPVVAEFMGFHQDAAYSESKLEQALIDNLERFILELGRGFAFVERQQHIVTETADFFIDLVFYNFKMKRFVIFELKTHKLTHQDIGQLDMYVRMYDDMVKGEDDQPTIGVLLCTDTDKTIARIRYCMRVTSYMLPNTSPICLPKKNCAARLISRNNSSWNNTIKNNTMTTSVKIYGYLEALLGETKSQKELIKEANRNYENPQHWNLDTEYLEPLNRFLKDNL